MPKNTWNSFCCLVVTCLWGLWLFVGLVVLLFLISLLWRMEWLYIKNDTSLFNLRLTSSHLCRTLHTIALWSVPSMLYPTTKISFTMPKTFCMSLNIASILLLSLGNILFNVGPLCIGLINAWFNHNRSKHNLTLWLALGTNTKLLHHSAISSTPSGVIMSSYCNLSSLSLNGFCSQYATCLGGTWSGLLSGLSCNENVPSKHPMPLNTLSNSVCICYVSLALFLLSV